MKHRPTNCASSGSDAESPSSRVVPTLAWLVFVGLVIGAAPNSVEAQPAGFRRCNPQSTVVPEFPAHFDFHPFGHGRDNLVTGISSPYGLASEIDEHANEVRLAFLHSPAETPGALEPVVRGTVAVVHGAARWTVIETASKGFERHGRAGQRATPTRAARLALPPSAQGGLASWRAYGPFELDGDGLPEWLLANADFSGIEDPSAPILHLLSVRSDELALVSPEFQAFDLLEHADGGKTALHVADGGQRWRFRIERGDFCVESLVHRVLDEARRAKPRSALPGWIPPRSRVGEHGIEILGSVSTRVDLGGRPQPEEVVCAWRLSYDFTFECRPTEGELAFSWPCWSRTPSPGMLRILPTKHDGYHDLLCRDVEVLRASCGDGRCTYESFAFGKALEPPPSTTP